MSSEHMSQKQSLEIIQEMIHTARQQHAAGAAFYYVLWGSLVMLFSILTFLAVKTNGTWHPWTYNIFLIGGIISYLHSRRESREEKSKSWFDNLYKFVWTGVGICLGITWGFAGVIGLSNVIPVSLLLYGLASFITGGTTKYYPSLVGAVVCFIFVAVALNVSFALQHLVCAAAVLSVHVIPGLIMLSKKHRSGYAQ